MNKNSKGPHPAIPWLNLGVMCFLAGGLATSVTYNTTSIGEFKQVNQDLTRSITTLNVTMSAFGADLRNREAQIKDMRLILDKHEKSIDEHHDSIIKLQNR